MDTKTILAELSQDHYFPHDALAAAGERRAELVPLFLAEIDAWLAGDSESRRTRPNPLFYAFHLLGEWRATEAWRPVCRLLRAPPDDIDHLLGDASTETAKRVLAGLFDGDPAPFFDAIRDPEADEFSRAEMFDAVSILGHEGRLDRETIKAFLTGCIATMQPRAECYAWTGVAQTVACLGFAELKDDVKKLMADGFIDVAWMDEEDFDLEFAAYEGTPQGEPLNADWTPLDDTIGLLASWWAASRRGEEPVDDDEIETRFWDDEGDAVEEPQAPVTNPFRDVGRNDPCPCGSGRKFKKCCYDKRDALAAEQAPQRARRYG